MALTKSLLTSSNAAPNTTTYTSAALSTSPSAGCIIVALVNVGYAATAGNITSVVDSHSNTYANPVVENCAFGFVSSGIYTFPYASAPGSTTLKVTCTQAIAAIQISPILVTGQASSQTGAATLGFQANSGTLTMEDTITTSRTGSQVYTCASQQIFATPTATAASGNTQINYYDVSGELQGWTGYVTSTTGTPGSTNTGCTVSVDTASSGWAICALEILPPAAAYPTAAFFPFFPAGP